MVDDESWWQRAACRDRDPEWWADDIRMRRTAVEICIHCPVRSPCHADAVRTGGHGVVRAGQLLTDYRDGVVFRTLICTACGTRPVIMMARGGSDLCAWCVVDRPGRLVA